MSQMSIVSARMNYYNDAQEPTAGEMLADTVLVRVPMFVATVVGVVTFVVTLPFSALGGNVDEAGRTLVLEPAEYTFMRPLGDL
jgi:phosphotransferase system  glucose/maltose/N-acetylglucosamine-specific IIC component